MSDIEIYFDQFEPHKYNDVFNNSQIRGSNHSLVAGKYIQILVRFCICKKSFFNHYESHLYVRRFANWKKVSLKIFHNRIKQKKWNDIVK